METITLEVQSREVQSRGQLNALRKSGWIPAVLYGGSAKESKPGSVLLKVNEKNFAKTVGARRGNAILQLQWGTESAPAIIKEVQRHSVSRQLLHIDFQKILMTEKLEVKVPLRLVGEAPGVKLSGGILEHVTRELKIVCLPKDLPEEVRVDVSKLEIGNSIHVRDLPEIPGVQVLSDPNLIVTNVVAPTILEEAPAAAAAAPGAAEPEVIAKGKKPEEGAEGAAAAPAKPGEKPAAAAPAKGAAAPAKGGAPAGK